MVIGIEESNGGFRKYQSKIKVMKSVSGGGAVISKCRINEATRNIELMSATSNGKSRRERMKA